MSSSSSLTLFVFFVLLLLLLSFLALALALALFVLALALSLSCLPTLHIHSPDITHPGREWNIWSELLDYPEGYKYTKKEGDSDGVLDSCDSKKGSKWENKKHQKCIQWSKENVNQMNEYNVPANKFKRPDVFLP